MDYISYISLAISVLASLGGIYTYFAHDKKLKKQQALLNELNIEKLKADNQESKKANVRVSLEEDPIDQDAILKYSSLDALSRRSGKLAVINLGKAAATNIVVSLPSNWRPYCQPIHIGQLVPNEQRKYNIEWNDRGFFSKTAIVKWDDNFATNRSNEIKL